MFVQLIVDYHLINKLLMNQLLIQYDLLEDNYLYEILIHLMLILYHQ